MLNLIFKYPKKNSNKNKVIFFAFKKTTVMWVRRDTVYLCNQTLKKMKS